MSTQTPEVAERPKAGELPRNGQGVNTAYELARDGDVGQAILEGLIDSRERIANKLHYHLVKMSQEFDIAARQMENGRRQYVLSRSNWYAELPIEIEMLDQSTRAIEEAQGMADYASRTTPASAAYRLEQAAHALDMTAEAASPSERGDHPLAQQLRAEAARILAAEAARVQAEREAREAKKADERARRVARPMGAREKSLLATAEGHVLHAGRYVMASEKTALASLVERGYLTRQRTEEEGTHYAITDAGREKATQAS